MLGEEEQKLVTDRLEGLASTVTLVMFTQETGCPYCAETRELVEQIARLSGKVRAEIWDFDRDSTQVARYGVDKTPAIAIVGSRDYGVRYYGIPSGYELAALLDDMIDVSKGDSGLSPDSRAQLAGLEQKLHVQVFTTPT